MIDIEKVIKGLECCTIGGCPSIFSKAYAECPYTDSVGHCKMNCLHRDALELLKEQPEIIRCKDCRWGDPSYNAKGEDMVFCYNGDTGIEDGYLHEPNWFCAEGERKMGGKE